MKVNLDQLRVEIQQLNRSKKMYKVLKEELLKLGYWKLLRRGDPVKAHYVGRYGNKEKEDLF